MKIDDTVQKREDVGAEMGDILHRPVVGIEDGEEVVHPASMDERPGHHRQEFDLGIY